MSDESRTRAASRHFAGEQNPQTDPPLDFPDRDLSEMTFDDYRALGFLSGLEVHQQLLTRSKLFCRCPGGRYTKSHDAEVLRHMRPTLSELGEYDGTALMEFKTRKEIVYRLSRANVCTYEIDDTPPFEMDQEAVEIAVELCALQGLDLVSEIHVMRKQYLDGSIPTGFQRTAMIGLSGGIPFRVPELGVDRELHIRQLSLEEDSCREISDLGHRITFQTDRLGMPLTETVTEPELLTPWELQAGGHLLASTAQSTGRVQRGPGAARQDVNVSVAGGRRVEIKGVDNHRGLPRLVHNEGFRQLNLLRIREELRHRGVERSVFALAGEGPAWELSPLVEDAGRLLRRSDFAPIHDALERGHRVVAVRLPGFGGLLSRGTQPGVTFARELADRVRVIACLESRPFLLHSDIPDYGLSSSLWWDLSKRLRAGSGDAVVVLWGPEQDADTAVREICLRAAESLEGIPAETRQAFPDGTTGFERLLPGPDRMYPDTDTPPIPIPDQLVAEVRSRLPEPPWSRENRYQELGLDPQAARRLALAPWASLFDALELPASELAGRVAFALEKRLPFLRRRHRVRELPAPSRVRPLIEALTTGSILHHALEKALDALVLEPDQETKGILERFRAASGDQESVSKRIDEVVEDARDLPGRDAEPLLRWAMGLVMPAFLGRTDPLRVEASLRSKLLQAGLLEEGS